MKQRVSLKHEFVEYVPSELEDGVVYISITFKTVVHKCCCGCGSKTVTPLSPARWKLTFDGETISLHPSIGNWSFPCQSHYWIKRSKVEWSTKWAPEEIAAGRVEEDVAGAKYFENLKSPQVQTTVETVEVVSTPQEVQLTRNLWQRLKKWLLSKFRLGSR